MVHARRVVQAGGAVRRTRDQTRGLADAKSYQAEIAARQATLPDVPGEAASQVLRCVDSALVLPFEAGLKLEAELAEACRASDRSEGLRHIYRAERQLSRSPELRDARGWPIRSVGLVGGGAVAAELAVIALDAGLVARMHVVDDAAIKTTRAGVEAIYARAVSRGRLSERLRQSRLSRLDVTRALDEAASCDLVIETTGADHHSRAILLQRLMARAPEHTIVLTTGPCGRLPELAAGTGVPTHVMGLRTASPAHVMRLVELVTHAATAPEAVAACVMALRRMSRVPLRTGPIDAPVAQTLWLALVQAALALADTGVHPYRIEAALRDAGLRTGPFQWIDDTGFEAVQARLARAGWPGSAVLHGMAGAGRSGRADGAGFLLYPNGARGAPEPDRGLADLLRRMRPDRGLGDEDVVAVCLAVLANTGARLLRENAVMRPADLDVAMVYGNGFPRVLGGPMKAADLAGLFTVQRRLERLAERAHAVFAPDPKLLELVRNGLLFSDLDG
nr:3-hydroxyacyl-CoA dehydrogenase NAD-binding domain-containing protein [Mesobacterium pallidum]